MLTWNESIWLSLLVNVAIKSTVVLALAWVAAWLLRKRSAALLHLVWTAAFVVLLALPILSVSLPALRVSGAPRLLAPELLFHAEATVPDWSVVSSAADAKAHPAAVIPARLDWPAAILLLCAAGIVLNGLQMSLGLLAIARMRRRARPVTISGFSAWKRSAGIRRRVDVFEMEEGCMPLSFSLLRAGIFLPAEARTWDDARCRVVLLHELAHIQRNDTALHLLARSILGFYWWNPLAWIAWREFLKQREQAADDVVLNAGAPASEYASHLLEIARGFRPAGFIEPAAVAMARPSQLEGRLISVLESRRDRSGLRPSGVLAAGLLGIAVVMPLAALHAQNTENSAPQSTAMDLIHLGEQQSMQAKFVEAAATYSKALSLFGNAPESSIAYMHLGFLALTQNQIQPALNDFQQAKRANSASSAQALLWMAIAQQRQNNLQEAAALYQGALAAEDPNSAEAATTLELYSRLLQQEGNTGEASKTAQHATTIRAALYVQAPPFNPSTFANVYRVKDAGTPPRLISKAEPEYTEEARAAKYSGTVLVSVEIGPDGLAHNMRIIRGLGFGLNQRAMDAISHWKFAPATQDGQPVPVSAHIEVNFRLL